MSGHALPDGRIPVPLSAHDAALIGDDAAAIRAYLARRTDRPEPAEVAATLAATRPVRRHRAVARARDTAELATALSALATGDEHPLVARSSLNAAPRTAFVCPGQGAQWPSMGAHAYQHIPSYRNEVDRCTAAFAAVGLPSPLAYLTTPEKASGPWSQPHVQGAHFTHVVALAQVWRSHGVSPDITVGHSLGEVAAAYLAGAITLPEAAGVVAARATVLDTLPGEYGMAVLGTGVKQAQRLAAETAGWLEVSVVNSPSSTVLSG
jgi:mycobactin polyketide synthetase MbtD